MPAFPSALPSDLRQEITARLESAWDACAEGSTFTDWRQALDNPDLPPLLHAPLFCLACYAGNHEVARAAWEKIEETWGEQAWQRLEALYCEQIYRSTL